MQCLQTVILHHQTLKDSHYDWLWVNPNHQDQLTGFRMPISATHWQAQQAWPLIPLPPHRMIYLDYQGSISGNRGTVVRVAQGWLTPLLWAQGRWRLEVHLTAALGNPQELASVQVSGQSLSNILWQAHVCE